MTGMDIGALLNPRSIAIFGVSTRAGTTGQIILRRVREVGFDGPVYLLGRTAGTIDNVTIETDPRSLPAGIDLAILTMPADGLEDALRACAERGIRSAVSFASGFAETGEEGRAAQARITEMARRAGIALLGPNTVGFYNRISGLTVMMIDQAAPPRLDQAVNAAVAIVAQSGGVANHLLGSFNGRGVPTSYVVTTGNEAVLGVEALADAFLDDARTRVIAAYSEAIGNPQAFLALGAKARRLGKAVVLLHPGRTSAGKAAASSHTGSLAGNYQAMEQALAASGVLLVETQEELLDVAELLVHHPVARPGGAVLITTSGALCAMTADYAEPLELDLPALSPHTIEALGGILPPYLRATNPLDLGTMPAWKPEMVGDAARVLLEDGSFGALAVSLPLTEPDRMMAWLGSLADAVRSSGVPTILVLAGEDVPLSAELLGKAARAGIAVMRSHERALRALATYQRHAREALRKSSITRRDARVALDLPASGPLAEWAGKAAMTKLGVTVPTGTLARSADDAVAVAARIGFPVVLKAQAPALMHKSEVGGVALSLADADAVRAAYGRLIANVGAALPDMTLDGVLVEAMGEKGVELVVGATRDADWGPMVMVGLGGIWVEALRDVRLFPPGLDRAAIRGEIMKLRAAKLLTGFRGAEPVNLDAVIDVVEIVGYLILDQPAITEIDINPLVATPAGAIALDVLVVRA